MYVEIICCKDFVDLLLQMQIIKNTEKIQLILHVSEEYNLKKLFTQNLMIFFLFFHFIRCNLVNNRHLFLQNSFYENILELYCCNL